MGQWGDKTYESDYLEDIINDLRLDPDDRGGEPPTQREISDILNNEDDQEVFLGIVSFLIDIWDSPEKFLSEEILKVAFTIAEFFLKDIEYASQWLHNWNDRIEGLKEEMENIYKLLNPGTSFDFLRYEKINQSELFCIDNWNKFDEDHKFYVIHELSKNPKKEATEILRADISLHGKTPSRLVLGAIALSKLNGEDALEVILENVRNSFLWVKLEAKEYLKTRLINEDNKDKYIKIEEIIDNL